MDLVLGLSMTSSTVRWVLVQGTTGEGPAIDRGSFDFDATIDPDELLDVVLVDVVGQLHAIGVTWTSAAEQIASGVLQGLAERGFGNAIAVSALEAGEVLAAGIADIAEFDDVAVCIVEPDAAVVTMVTPAGVMTDRIGRPLDGADVVELPSSVITLLELNEWRPQAIFVVGSARDRDLIVSTLGDVTESPVFSAAEADLALARGAALASARAVNTLDASGTRVPSMVGALASVLVAAVVTFVVAVSAAVGLGLTGHRSSAETHAANAVEQPPAPEPAAPPVAQKVTTPAEARPVVAQTIVVAAPPPEAPPVEQVSEPPAYVPPEPAYTPPAPAAVPPAPAPVYTPPPAYAPPPVYTAPPNYVPPQPRLRDRIIERIPIINRFHEPDYSNYPR